MGISDAIFMWTNLTFDPSQGNITKKKLNVLKCTYFLFFSESIKPSLGSILIALMPDTD